MEHLNIEIVLSVFCGVVLAGIFLDVLHNLRNMVFGTSGARRVMLEIKSKTE